MKKKLHIFDLDGTLLLNNCSLSFFLFLRKKGLFSFKEQLCAYWYSLRFKWLPGAGKTIHEVLFRRLFKGRSSEEILPLIDPFLDSYLSSALRQSLFKQLKELQKRGDSILLLSNSPSFLVSKIAERLGIPSYRATEYGMDEAKRWQTIDFMLDGPQKALIAKEYVKNQGLMNNDMVVYSDSMDDLPLLEIAGEKVVVSPDKRLKRIAQNRGYANHQ